MDGSISHHVLHIVTAAVALVLFAISFLAYNRNRNRKFLYVCMAFFIFAIKEIAMAINIISTGSSSIEILTHILNLVILVLFAIGILK